MLLAFDLFFMTRALMVGSYIPIVPIVASIFTAIGLLLIVLDEHRARAADRRDHRRLSRVALQLEGPLLGLEQSLESLQAQSSLLPAELRLKLKHMDTKTKLLLENIRDVFMLFQAQEEQVAMESRPYNLCVLVQSVIDAVLPQARAANVDIVLASKHAEIPVVVDKRLFNIVLTHLLDNAMRYTLKPGLINVVFELGSRRAQVVVQDRGIGISEADAIKIWQPFARGDRAVEFDPDGIGTGLSLSRLLLKQMNGDLKLISGANSGTGSAFAIELPVAK